VPIKRRDAMGWGSLKKAFKIAAASFIGGPAGSVAVASKEKLKEQKRKSDEESAAALSKSAAELAAEKEKTYGYEEKKKEQEAMRKKFATFGRVAAGTAFNDVKVGSSKVYS
jgi:hypothetical protein